MKKKRAFCFFSVFHTTIIIGHSFIHSCFVFVDYVTRGSKHIWNEYCKGIVSMVTVNQYSYTVQPRPELGRVDLAGAFFNTNRFKEANVLFSKYSFSLYQNGRWFLK